YYGPAVGVGPTVMLPVAALFNLFEVSIPLARLAIVVYGFVALAALYGLSRRFMGHWPALTAVALVLLSPGTDFPYNSRTVLGEVPGIAFLLAGLWLWLRPETRRLPGLVAVGLLIGLACITKNQYALFILPALLLAWISDLVWYKRRGWLYFVVPGAIAGALFFGWTLVVLVALGGQGDLAANLATLRRAAAGAFFMFNPAAIERAVSFLMDGGVYSAMFIPALLYGVFLSVRRDDDGQQYGILMLFILGGTAMFLTSLGWGRYAFAPVVLGSVLVARLFADLTGGRRFDWSGLRRLARGETATPAVIALVLLCGVAINAGLLPLYARVHAVFDHGSGDAYTLAEYLDANVPRDALIETWEQELAVLTDHAYHYPPQVILAYAVAETWEGATPARDLYDFRESGTPDYVIVGPFGKYTLIYSPERLEDYDLIYTAGAYDVYRRKPAV
ncbi:MAG: glycosyltransferase family 39 protein, partial [Chloroflexi bacterium]|nr:glycosyltransferase family 39 protein [Chloroflexota bacterium]